MADGTVYFALSVDRCILVIKRRMPGGVATATLRRAVPFTDAAIAVALAEPPGERMQPGQRNITRRADTRFGTLWTHVMTGPPTWPRPRLRREHDGTLMAGWLRLAVAVKFDRRGRLARRGPRRDRQRLEGKN